MQPQQPKRVLIFCLSGLGDAVMTSPAIAALAERPQEFRLTLLTMFRSVTDYLREQQFTDDVRYVDFLKGGKLQALKAVRALRRERFDVSIVCYPQNRIENNT